ncbi:MAG TPA: histidine kinase [Puia sp.]|nr:histidine kinase [Puia sp.]
MKFFKGQATIVQLQWLVWLAVFLIVFFSMLPQDGFRWSASFALVNVSFYSLIIYGNIKFLFPVYYERGKKLQYVLLVIILLISAGLARGYLIISLYNSFRPDNPESWTIGTAVNFVLAGFLTYMLSFIFRIAIAYFALKQQSEKILAQKSQAELNLLKSQVQPHFLFNTLNNIYYEAYREAPRTAALIERLSNIMRYFVDESTKDEVSLQTEIQFIENYIALEKIRIRHEAEIHFSKKCNGEASIPPMLLMTFVENIFKHGIDKSSSHNKVDISLVHEDGHLLFQTRNQVHKKQLQKESHGFGIQNLRKRLTLLFGTKFELNIDQSDHYFTAFLKVPLS